MANDKSKSDEEKTTYWIKQNHLFGPPTYKCHACKSVVDKPEDVCPMCHARVVDKKEDPVWVDEISVIDSIFDE